MKCKCLSHYKRGVDTVAKLRPQMVMYAEFNEGELFGLKNEVAGASNENILTRVPTTVLTVTTPNFLPKKFGVDNILQHKVVADVHEVLPHCMSPPTVALGVKPQAPKFSPVIVTDVPPLAATFA